MRLDSNGAGIDKGEPGENMYVQPDCILILETNDILKLNDSHCLSTFPWREDLCARASYSRPSSPVST